MKYRAIIILLSSITHLFAQDAIVINLKCNYQSRPMGMDDSAPALSWQISSTSKSWMQRAYEIKMSDEEALLNSDTGNIWESGKVISSQNVHIRYQGKPLTSATHYYWKVRVWDSKGKAGEWSKNASFTTGFLNASEWKGKWISSRFVESKKCHLQIPERENEYLRLPDNPDTAAILIRKTFDMPKQATRATAFISGLGYYELYINNQKVGDHVLDPNFTDYTIRTNYVTYDVSSFIKQGKNTIGVILGNGFFNLPTPDLFQFEKSCWKAAPKLLLNLKIEYSDGSTEMLVTDKTWKWSTGEFVFNCIRGGETIDKNLEKKGWQGNDFNDADWNPATEVPAPFGKLSTQYMPAIKVMETLKAVKISELKNGIYIFDFGKNITGWPVMKIKGTKGQTYILQCNEKLLKDSTLDMECNRSHTFGRFQTEVFISSGNGEETFEPRFNYHGFRYVQVTGFTSKPSPDCIVAKSVYTDLEHAGSFECSNKRLNQLHAAVRHTLLDCIHGMPGEEPSREKMGWTQDGQNTMDAYVYNFDAATSYIKYMRDMTDAQEATGHIPPIVPTNGWGYLQPNCKTIFCDDPWWGGSLAVVVNKLYQFYGDQRVIEEAYIPMKHYVDFLTSYSSNHFITWSLGDWLDKEWGWPQGPGLTSVEFTSTAGYFYFATLLYQHALMLGKAEDEKYYRNLAESIKTAFNKKFLNSTNGTYERGSQTAQAIALTTGIVPDDMISKAEGVLLEDIRKNNDHTTTGFLGIMPEMNYLADHSNAEVAYRMLSQEKDPGWLYMVEDENSTLGEKLYADQYGNYHHPFAACIGSWFYAYMGGIRPFTPGFKEIIIKPEILNDISWVKSSYRSLYGEIKSDWKKEGSKVIMDILIPANSTALIYVPSEDISKIKADGKNIQGSKHLIFIKNENGRSLFTAGSGHYKVEFVR